MRTPQQKYDLLLLSFNWLRLQKPTTKLHALLVFHALTDLRLITTYERGKVATDPNLLKLVRDSTHTLPLTGRTDRAQIDKLVRMCDEKLVMTIPPRQTLDTRRILGRNGYDFYLTEVGIAYAEKIEAPYARWVTDRAFIAAWDKARERLASAMPAMLGRDGSS